MITNCPLRDSNSCFRDNNPFNRIGDKSEQHKIDVEKDNIRGTDKFLSDLCWDLNFIEQKDL